MSDDKLEKKLDALDQKWKAERRQQKIDEVFYVLKKVFWYGIYPAFVIWYY